MTVYLMAVAAQVILYTLIAKCCHISRTKYVRTLSITVLGLMAGLAWLMLPWIDAVVATVVAVVIAVMIDD